MIALRASSLETKSAPHGALCSRRGSHLYRPAAAASAIAAQRAKAISSCPCIIWRSFISSLAAQRSHGDTLSSPSPLRRATATRCPRLRRSDRAMATSSCPCTSYRSSGASAGPSCTTHTELARQTTSCRVLDALLQSRRSSGAIATRCSCIIASCLFCTLSLIMSQYKSLSRIISLFARLSDESLPHRQLSGASATCRFCTCRFALCACAAHPEPERQVAGYHQTKLEQHVTHSSAV
jgi:hypothetical protein